MRAAPAFAVTAPKMASGKTLIATVTSYIATGQAPAMMSQADDAESERKRLFSVLLEGAAIGVIDNVERTFASDALCSILTEPVFKDRVLGVPHCQRADLHDLVCHRQQPDDPGRFDHAHAGLPDRSRMRAARRAALHRQFA